VSAKDIPFYDKDGRTIYIYDWIETTGDHPKPGTQGYFTGTYRTVEAGKESPPIAVVVVPGNGTIEVHRPDQWKRIGRSHEQ
jgi:hypothetical protein